MPIWLVSIKPRRLAETDRSSESPRHAGLSTFGSAWRRSAPSSFTFDSSRRLNGDSNFAPIRRWTTPGRDRRRATVAGTIALARASPVVKMGEAGMGRFEVMGIDAATLGEANAAEDVFFQLGMMYSTGSTVPAD